MENNNDVTQDSSPEVREDQTQAQEVEETPTVASETKETVAPGTKTPQENLLAALQEEREKRRELEEEIKNLTTVPQVDDTDDELSLRIRSLEDRIELQDLQAKFPQLKDLSPEFNEFRKDYPRHKGENVAKLFLTEKGLMESKRVGLEKATGGDKVAPTPEMTRDDVERLRKTDWRKYTDMVKKGLINI